MIQQRIKDVWNAVEALQEEAFELPKSHRQDICINICGYLKQDLRLVAFQFGIAREELAK